jgi:predicted nucleic acid-binding protein
MTFADTSYFLALLNPDDKWHVAARKASAELADTILSTDWVLAEVTDAKCRGHNRTKVVSFPRMLRRREDVVLLPASRELFDRGLQLFGDRPDKEWSLTDCIDFVVMRERNLTEALTSDHHFEQAGFTALLKAP